MQALVDRHRQFVDNTLTNGKPVKFTQDTIRYNSRLVYAKIQDKKSSSSVLQMGVM